MTARTIHEMAAAVVLAGIAYIFLGRSIKSSTRKRVIEVSGASVNPELVDGTRI